MKLHTMKFEPEECLDAIILQLEGLINVCDGRKMDERLAREFGSIVHELNLVKREVFK